MVLRRIPEPQPKIYRLLNLSDLTYRYINPIAILNLSLYKIYPLLYESCNISQIRKITKNQRWFYLDPELSIHREKGKLYPLTLSFGKHM